jgi:hypothetical protein
MMSNRAHLFLIAPGICLQLSNGGAQQPSCVLIPNGMGDFTDLRTIGGIHEIASGKAMKTIWISDFNIGAGDIRVFGLHRPSGILLSSMHAKVD